MARKTSFPSRDREGEVAAGGRVRGWRRARRKCAHGENDAGFLERKMDQKKRGSGMMSDRP